MAKIKQKGIFLPEEILNMQELSTYEMLVLATIAFLDNGSGCYANNKYFANKLHLSEKTVSRTINDLYHKGYIDHIQIAEQGNKRTLIPYRNKFIPSGQIVHTLESNSPDPLPNLSIPSGQIVQHNKDSNKELNKDIKKEYSYKDNLELSTTNDTPISENIVPLDFKKWLTEQIQYGYPEILKMQEQLTDWQIKKLESLGYERTHFEQALLDMNNKPELRSKTVYTVLYSFAKRIHDNDPKVIHKAYLRKIHI